MKTIKWNNGLSIMKRVREREQGNAIRTNHLHVRAFGIFFFFFGPPRNLSGFYLNITHFCMFCGY